MNTAVIKELRRERGWTQRELADRAGIAAGQIARLETEGAEVNVTVDTLIKLAGAFEVEPARLLSKMTQTQPVSAEVAA